MDSRTQESRKEDAMVYPGSGQFSPYVQQLMIFILKSTQNLGVTTECKRERERFGRESLDAGPRDALLEWRKMTGAMEELSVPLSGLLCSRCRARMER